MTGIRVYDQIKKAFQDIVAPELHALRGDIRVLDQRISAVDQKIDAADARLSIKIDALRTETLSLKGELLAEIRRLDTRMDIEIRERLAALEARRT